MAAFRELLDHGVGRLQPVLGLLHAHAAQNVGSLGGNGRGQRSDVGNLFWARDLDYYLDRRFPCPRCAPRKHLEQHDAETVHVGARADCARVGRLLGGYVAGRAEHGVCHRDKRVEAFRGLCDSEVKQHRRAISRDNDVLRLEVAVHHAEAPGEGENVADLEDGAHCVAFLHGAAERDCRAQRVALHVVHHEVVEPAFGVVACVVHFREVRMLYAACELRLAHESLRAFVPPVPTAGVHRLQCEEGVEKLVADEPHRSRSAAAKNSFHYIALEYVAWIEQRICHCHRVSLFHLLHQEI